MITAAVRTGADSALDSTVEDSLYHFGQTDTAVATAIQELNEILARIDQTAIPDPDQQRAILAHFTTISTKLLATQQAVQLRYSGQLQALKAYIDDIAQAAGMAVASPAIGRNSVGSVDSVTAMDSPLSADEPPEGVGSPAPTGAAILMPAAVTSAPTAVITPVPTIEMPFTTVETAVAFSWTVPAGCNPEGAEPITGFFEGDKESRKHSEAITRAAGNLNLTLANYLDDLLEASTREGTAGVAQALEQARAAVEFARAQLDALKEAHLKFVTEHTRESRMQFVTGGRDLIYGTETLGNFNRQVAAADAKVEDYAEQLQQLQQQLDQMQTLEGSIRKINAAIATANQAASAVLLTEDQAKATAEWAKVKDLFPNADREGHGLSKDTSGLDGLLAAATEANRAAEAWFSALTVQKQSVLDSLQAQIANLVAEKAILTSLRDAATTAQHIKEAAERTLSELAARMAQIQQRLDAVDRKFEPAMTTATVQQGKARAFLDDVIAAKRQHDAEVAAAAARTHAPTAAPAPAKPSTATAKPGRYVDPAGLRFPMDLAPGQTYQAYVQNLRHYVREKHLPPEGLYASCAAGASKADLEGRLKAIYTFERQTMDGLNAEIEKTRAIVERDLPGQLAEFDAAVAALQKKLQTEFTQQREHVATALTKAGGKPKALEATEARAHEEAAAATGVAGSGSSAPSRAAKLTAEVHLEALDDLVAAKMLEKPRAKGGAEPAATATPAAPPPATQGGVTRTGKGKYTVKTHDGTEAAHASHHSSGRLTLTAAASATKEQVAEGFAQMLLLAYHAQVQASGDLGVKNRALVITNIGPAGATATDAAHLAIAKLLINKSRPQLNFDALLDKDPKQLDALFASLNKLTHLHPSRIRAALAGSSAEVLERYNTHASTAAADARETAAKAAHNSGLVVTAAGSAPKGPSWGFWIAQREAAVGQDKTKNTHSAAERLSHKLDEVKPASP